MSYRCISPVVLFSRPHFAPPLPFLVSSPGIWSLIRWVSASSSQSFFSCLWMSFLATSWRDWIVSSPGASAFYITSTAHKTLLVVQFSLASSLVSSSFLLDGDATICLYIITPGLLCTVFSYLAQEDLQVGKARHPFWIPYLYFTCKNIYTVA